MEIYRGVMKYDKNFKSDPYDVVCWTTNPELAVDYAGRITGGVVLVAKTDGLILIDNDEDDNSLDSGILGSRELQEIREAKADGKFYKEYNDDTYNMDEVLALTPEANEKLNIIAVIPANNFIQEWF